MGNIIITMANTHLLSLNVLLDTIFHLIKHFLSIHEFHLNEAPKAGIV